MPFSDHPPALVVPDCKEGRAARISMIAEEPEILADAIYVCSSFSVTRFPVYTDDDLYRPKDIPVCANRSRAGVRDRSWCYRCLAGFPHSFQEKNHETYADSAISVQ